MNLVKGIISPTVRAARPGQARLPGRLRGGALASGQVAPAAPRRSPPVPTWSRSPPATCANRLPTVSAVTWRPRRCAPSCAAGRRAEGRWREIRAAGPRCHIARRRDRRRPRQGEPRASKRSMRPARPLATAIGASGRAVPSAIPVGYCVATSLPNALPMRRRSGSKRSLLVQGLGRFSPWGDASRQRAGPGIRDGCRLAPPAVAGGRARRRPGRWHRHHPAHWRPRRSVSRDAHRPPASPPPMRSVPRDLDAGLPPRACSCRALARLCYALAVHLSCPTEGTQSS
jgi:hypothetical protein